MVRYCKASITCLYSSSLDNDGDGVVATSYGVVAIGVAHALALNRPSIEEDHKHIYVDLKAIHLVDV